MGERAMEARVVAVAETYIALESHTLVHGEQEYDVTGRPEGLGQKLLVFQLRRPEPIALSSQDILMVPGFYHEVSYACEENVHQKLCVDGQKER
jgi:hypothetical protein